jgi:hypothetical protein
MAISELASSLARVPSGSTLRPQRSGRTQPKECLVKIRQLTQEMVIHGFLKNEFFRREFDQYRQDFANLVWYPDFHNEQENELRRALLFLRRGRLWRELPADTEWFEVELQLDALNQIRVFPRNHWLRFSRHGFYLSRILGNIHDWTEAHPSNPFSMKLRSLRAAFSMSDEKFGAVLLIGKQLSGPFTIIEGNHRMAAASLDLRDGALHRFTFVCGLSPRMTRCCWYRTGIFTLSRYAVRSLTYLFDDHKRILRRDLGRRLQNRGLDAVGVDVLR